MINDLNEDKRQINSNLKSIRSQIVNATKKSGRLLQDISIIGVTKTIDVDKMEMLYDEGIISFGENKVQELMDKYDRFQDRIKWHLIGHLQTNKVKYIVGKVELIHSVDSIDVLGEIDKRARKLGIIQNVLIQVNVSGEETKYGFSPDEVAHVIKVAKDYKSIKVKGLMTMAPNYENVENTRPVFRGLKDLYDNISKGNHENVKMEVLSMGMTHDYEVAIEEGSNMIRLGTAIFGKKNVDIRE